MSENYRHAKKTNNQITKKRQTGQNKTNKSKELLNDNKPVKDARKNELAQRLGTKNKHQIASYEQT